MSTTAPASTNNEITVDDASKQVVPARANTLESSCAPPFLRALHGACLFPSCGSAVEQDIDVAGRHIPKSNSAFIDECLVNSRQPVKHAIAVRTDGATTFRRHVSETRDDGADSQLPKSCPKTAMNAAPSMTTWNEQYGLGAQEPSCTSSNCIQTRANAKHHVDVREKSQGQLPSRLGQSGGCVISPVATTDGGCSMPHDKAHDLRSSAHCQADCSNTQRSNSKSTPEPENCTAPKTTTTPAAAPFQALFDSGRQLMQQKRWTEAADRFREYVQAMEQTDTATIAESAVSSESVVSSNTCDGFATPLCNGYQHLGLCLLNSPGSHHMETLLAFRRCLRLRIFYNSDTIVAETLLGSALAAMQSSTDIDRICRLMRSSVEHEHRGDQLLFDSTKAHSLPMHVGGQYSDPEQPVLSLPDRDQPNHGIAGSHHRQSLHIRVSQAAVEQFRSALYLEESINRLVLAHAAKADADRAMRCHGDLLYSAAKATIDEANIRCKLASAYVVAGQPSKGLEQFRDALRTYTNHSIATFGGGTVPCTERCIRGIRASAMILGFPEGEIEAYVDATTMALVQESMGDEYVAIGDMQQALQHYAYALGLEDMGIGKKRPGLASVYTKMAGIHEVAGELQQAMSCYCYALPMYEPVLGCTDHKTLRTKQKIRGLLAQLQARRIWAPEDGRSAREIHTRTGLRRTRSPGSASR